MREKTKTTNILNSPKSKILVVTRTFLPKEGGIEEYAYNRCLQDTENIIVLTADCIGSKDFDAQQSFSIYRWWTPSWLPGGALGSLSRQILNMIGSLLMSLRLYFRYQYHSIEWCHGYDFPSLWLLSYLLPVQTYMYLHGNDLLCPLRSPVLKFPFAMTLGRLNGIVCNSSFTEKYLRSHFTLQSPSYVINPSVRASKFGSDNAELLAKKREQIRQSFGINSSAIVLLSVGRLVKRKGCDRVIRQIPDLRKKNIDVHYIVCGRGAMEAELKYLAARLEVSDRVHFAGFVPDKALAGYYAACDIFTLLTFFNEDAASIEGFGIVYVEAGFFGKPVLATNIGGVTDAIQNKVNGLLVDPEDEQTISNSLLQLCQDRKLREQLGSKGKDLAHRQSSHQSIYQS